MSNLLRFTALAGFLALMAAALSAEAAQRTFVSTAGSDANTAANCSRPSPCRGFTAALTVTDAGGEIIVLDSGGYGAVAIAQSVSIIAPEGVYAGISVFSGSGASIATAGVNVILRGLTFNGLGGASGVNMSDGAGLVVDRCHFRNFTDGVYFAAAGKLRVLDSIFNANGYGIQARGGTAMIARSSFFENSYGAYVAATAGETVVAVEKSVASGSTASGFYVSAASGATARLMVTESSITGNVNGVFAYALSGSTVSTTVSNSTLSYNSNALRVDGGAVMVVSGNTVTRNNMGLSNFSSTLKSAGNNAVEENLGNTSGTITSFVTM
ncbi:MAG: right-handed parallel beta-helix repeat-containing protein [Betaproteobacteria bacterium]|nr:right-handed parallel beta-helix repeat-containing protein [Betaproteobacteria bacterium]